MSAIIDFLITHKEDFRQYFHESLRLTIPISDIIPNILHQIQM